LPDTITQYFGNGNKFGVNINYSHEKKAVMGGAGALKCAQNLLKQDSFIVLNGDVMTNLDLTQMAKFHQEKKGIGTFLVHQTDHPHDSDLIEYDDNFLIKRFYRPKIGDKFNPISKSGTHIFKPEVLNYIPRNTKYSLEGQLIPDLLEKRKKLYAYYSDDYSKDMGTPERLKQVKIDYVKNKISF